MTHDPLCPYQPSKIQCSKDHECGSGIIIPESDVKCQCDLIGKVRDEERWATVESSVFVASQYGCDYGLLNALNAIRGDT